MGLVIFYALINWMPILFKDAGIDPRTATLISALFHWRCRCDFVRLVHGPVQRQLDYCDRLWPDGDISLRDWAVDGTIWPC